MSAVPVTKMSLRSVMAAQGKAERQARLRLFVQELTNEVSAADPDDSQELLSALIAELAMFAADQRRRSERRQKQAEGIAAAKARGVQFGRQPIPLPDGFDQCFQAWQDGELSLRQAAESCGMGRTSFRRAALRRQESSEETAAL